MTTKLAYPRLRRADTLFLLEKMREVARVNPAGLQNLSSNSHPRAEAIPTGAKIATVADLDNVRNHVLENLDPWLGGDPVARDWTVRFDLALGRSLHESLNILPADAAHEGTWEFLSAVLLPDIVWTRFPDLHQDRVLGKRHRNTLRRAWFRYDVIGDLQEAASNPLGEDEMTGVFERSQVARDRNLVRMVTELILESRATNRSEFTRGLMKGVTALTGTHLLDGLGPDELRDRVLSLTQTQQPDLPFEDPAVAVEEIDEGTRVDAPATRVTGTDKADVVRRFHVEVLERCSEIEEVLGHPPRAYLRMISQMGGVEAARAVVGSPSPSATFTRLWLGGRPDLTLEALVIREEFRGLFSEALREQATSRMAEITTVPQAST